MSRQTRVLPVVLTIFAMLMTGCQPQQPFYFFEDGDMSHYVGIATDIDYPDAEVESFNETRQAQQPRTLKDPDERKAEHYPLSLQDAVQFALANSKVVRLVGASANLAAFTSSPPEFLTSNPLAATTMYDPAIVESNPRFGVEAALSQFDAQFSTSVFWEKINRPRNIQGQQFFSNTLDQDLGTFQARLAKIAADGSQWFVSHNASYQQDLLNPLARFDSAYEGDLTAGFRKPLGRGSGTQFTRIAGIGAIPGFNNGVVIARIQTDKALTKFEADVTNLVKEVETAYWALYLAYRRFDAVKEGRESVLRAWRRVKTFEQTGDKRGGRYNVVLAEEQFYLFDATMKDSLNRLYTAESKLRYLLGWAVTDEYLIRPTEDPVNTFITFDWGSCLEESLYRRVELRQQKWDIKQKELELIASKNYLLPQIDAVGEYRWRGMGDHLIDENDKSGREFNSLYESMTGGDFQEWQLGIDVKIPLGFRKERSGVRFAQANLTKAKALLREQESEVSHQLGHAMRELAAQYELCKTNLNRWVAARKQYDVAEILWREAPSAGGQQSGPDWLDKQLDAQRRVAEAESEYFAALINYNVAIIDVHFRKGSLLEYNNVSLAEGPWPCKAYFDAQRRARARDAATFIDYGFTRPDAFSLGPHAQFTAEEQFFPGEVDGTVIESDSGPWPTRADEDSGIRPEPIPTPRPVFDAPAGSEQSQPLGRSNQRQSLETTRKSTELNFDALADLTVAATQATPAGQRDVRHAGYEEVDSRTAIRGTAISGPGIARPETSHEPFQNPPSASAHRPAPVWKAAKR